jgi:hypothetical protein
VTYEPGRKFTDKINKVILSDSRVQVVSEMNLEELIRPELWSFQMNFKLMVSHRETSKESGERLLQVIVIFIKTPATFSQPPS